MTLRCRLFGHKLVREDFENGWVKHRCVRCDHTVSKSLAAETGDGDDDEDDDDDDDNRKGVTRYPGP